MTGMENDPTPADEQPVNRDGFAAMAILVVTIGFIALVVIALL